jgi:hypothetical protein
MVNNADCNFRGGEWVHPDAEKDELAMQALHDKLEVITTRKEGWILKDQLISIWHSAPDEDLEMFQRITWEEEV